MSNWIKKLNSCDNLDLDDEIMQDMYSFGFKSDHLGQLAQFSLGAPSDIDADFDDYGYPEP